MIVLNDWVADIPPEERCIGYTGENGATRREFLITDTAYSSCTFHLDMAFDLPTVTDTDGPHQIRETTSSSSRSADEGESETDASETVDSYTKTEVTVDCDDPTDIAYLQKELRADGIHLFWTVLAQQTRLPGRLRAMIRADSVDGTVKKSAPMFFEVGEGISATAATVPEQSEFEAMEERMDELAEEGEEAATLSKSYAVGGTGSRTGENTDNAKYYAQQAATSAAQANAAKTAAQSAETAASGSASTAATYASAASGAANDAHHAEGAARTYKDAAAGSADAAAGSAEAAAGSAEEAAGSAAEALESAEEAIDSATEAAQSAEAASEAAASAAQSAGYSNHPPRISDNGYWEVWNGTAYEVTTYPARGKSGLPEIVTTVSPNYGIWAANKEYRFGGIGDLTIWDFTNDDQTIAPLWTLQFKVDSDYFQIYSTENLFEWYLAEPQFVRGNRYLLTFFWVANKIMCVWMEVAA